MSAEILPISDFPKFLLDVYKQYIEKEASVGADPI